MNFDEDKKEEERDSRFIWKKGDIEIEYPGHKKAKEEADKKKKEAKDAAVDQPHEVFLDSDNHKYPIKIEDDGNWIYDYDLLLAAIKETRDDGEEKLASRAEEIFRDEFGEAEDELSTGQNSALPVGIRKVVKLEEQEPVKDAHIALDADPSNRTYSQDGHLHVKENVVSAAQVNDYRAEEIPGWKELGLQAGRVYALLRDPVELEKSLSDPKTSIHGKPLVIVHKAQTADEHDKEITVGAVMNPRWEYPNLIAEITVWDGEAIKDIESNEQSDLSSGYHYKPVMESGEFNGTKFDGRMKNISFNHLCLVRIGRVIGSMVGDSEDDPWRLIEQAILGVNK
jgi:hypothetical protein